MKNINHMMKRNNKYSSMFVYDTDDGDDSTDDDEYM